MGMYFEIQSPIGLFPSGFPWTELILDLDIRKLLVQSFGGFWIMYEQNPWMSKYVLDHRGTSKLNPLPGGPRGRVRAIGGGAPAVTRRPNRRTCWRS